MRCLMHMVLLTGVCFSTHGIAPPGSDDADLIIDGKSRANPGILRTDTNVSSTRLELFNSGLHISKDVISMLEKQECKIFFSAKSKAAFTEEILRNKYNFVYLRLKFPGLKAREAPSTIIGNHWVWTYKGVDGAYQYLFASDALGFFSFGLLLAHTRRQLMSLTLKHAGQCKHLRVGEVKTDLKIGKAFADLTSDIAMRDARYNSSHWCYRKRKYISSDTVYNLCKNVVCTLQTMEFSCCKYTIDIVTKSRSVECSKGSYYYGSVWWNLPTILGVLTSVFFPLLLTTIARGVKSKSKTNRLRNADLYIRPLVRDRPGSTHERSRLSDYEQTSSTSANSQFRTKDAYVALKHSSPVTFVATVSSPICRLLHALSCLSRSRRLLIFVVPSSLTALHVLLEYRFKNGMVKDAVAKGALFSFPSMLAGYQLSRNTFLPILGGPFVALGIMYIFGCSVLLAPADLGAFIEKGMLTSTAEYNLILSMPLKQREELSQIRASGSRGFKKINQYFLVNFFMLFNWEFWLTNVTLFKVRMTRKIHPFLSRIFHNSRLAFLGCLLVFPVYIIACIIELAASTLYFAFPAISCFFILLKAATRSSSDFCRNRSFMVKVLWNILLLSSLCLFIITWYTYYLLFFAGMRFVFRVVLLTYTGVIAYPKMSYGYLILVIMTIYYLVESIRDFDEGYRLLLKVSIEACVKVEQKYLRGRDSVWIVHKGGIPKTLYTSIVKRHRPVRIQILATLMKFGLILMILGVSIDLLSKFDQFKSLSLLSHVFTILFICAVPKLCKTLCMAGKQQQMKRQMRKRIKKTVMLMLKTGEWKSLENNE